MCGEILILLALALPGQAPNPIFGEPPPAAAPVTRFDKMASVALEAKARSAARENASLPNLGRRNAVRTVLKRFALTDLHMAPPYTDAELTLIASVADEAAGVYDTTLKVSVPPISPAPAAAPPQDGYHDVIIGSRIYKVWGRPSGAKIRFNPEQQSPEVREALRPPPVATPPPQPVYYPGAACGPSGCSSGG